jgi:hypothetical protein
MRCPGQDQRYWTAEDIFDLRCPYCGYEIEFWKDEPFRICKQCSREIRNPRINLGCAKWCKNADACLGRSTGDDGNVAAPVVERLAAALEEKIQDDARLKNARLVCCRVDQSLDVYVSDPLSNKAVAILAGALMAEPTIPHEEAQSILEFVSEQAGFEEDTTDRIRDILTDVMSGKPSYLESRLVLSALNKTD